MRSRTLKHSVSAAALVLAALFHGGAARAEADSFGLGSGHDGALTVTTAQTVNLYGQVTAAVAAGATALPVGSRSGNFVPGQVVLVYQARGDFGTVLRPASGSQVAYNLGLVATTKVGRYEIARIAAVTSSTITLTHGLVNAYDAGVTQIVSVPEYTSVTINTGGSLVAKAWDGFTGGVLAFFATGAVTNNVAGGLSAAGKGYRGGIAADQDNIGSNGCAALDGAANNGGAGGGGGHKGEGPDVTAYSSDASFAGDARFYGRGNIASGGGGGDCFNAGGGGGGHGDLGGIGGRTNTDVDGNRAGLNVGGIGGAAVSYDPAARLSFGGGGGAGDADDGLSGPGGQGGGVVWIRAASLAGTGTIVADGANGTSSKADVTDPTFSDGAGGGGAGGGVYAWLSGSAVCGGISAKGGTGGDAKPTSGTRNYGPGGGGSGGRVLVASGGSTQCTATLSGGANGKTSGNGNAANGASTTGATSTSNARTAAFTQTTCAIGTGSCGGCVTDAFCSGTTPVCSTAPGANQWTCVAGSGAQAPYGQAPANGGTCTAAGTPTQGASVNCQNDLCDTSDNLCGYANGTACTGNDQCRSTVCDTDGKCGLANGSACTTTADHCRGACALALTCDVDTDHDGITDRDEATFGTNPNDADSDHDGIPDGVELRPSGGGAPAAIDTDGDGKIDALDTDSDNDSIPDAQEGTIDTDGDGIPDWRDPDDDNDGIPTRKEVDDANAAHLSDDVDHDGKKNWLDTDADGDGVPDHDEPGDVNHDGIADYLQASFQGNHGLGATPGEVGSLQGGGIGCASAGDSQSSWLAALGAFGFLAFLGRRKKRD